MMDDEPYSIFHPVSEAEVGIGLLGAKGRTYDEACENRLLEIERRILAIEAALTSNPIASDSSEAVPVVCASCGFPWGVDPVRHAEMCDNRQALATPEQGEKP